VSTVFTAPHAAGSPNAQASLRNVTVMRGRGAVRRPMRDELKPAEGMVDDELHRIRAVPLGDLLSDPTFDLDLQPREVLTIYPIWDVQDRIPRGRER
jgi:hypothetical protein